MAIRDFSTTDTIRRAATLIASFLISLALFFAMFGGSAEAALLVLSPSADTSVDSAKPTKNFGGDKGLYASYGGNQSLIFLIFDLSPIPPGSSISEATVKLYYTGQSDRTRVTIGAYRATSAWTEDTITWQKKPTGPGPQSTSVIALKPGFKSFDVTPFVDGWLRGSFPNYGLFLADQKNASFDASFASKEAGNRQPQLFVYYTPPASGADYFSGMDMAKGRPPSISEVKASNIAPDGATITWKSDSMTRSVVRYGESAAYDNEVSLGLDVNDHVVKLHDLKPGTTYHYRVSGENKAGLSSSSADFTFMTAGTKEDSGSRFSLQWGWLKLVGWIILFIALVVGAVIGTYELQRWLRHHVIKRR